MKTRVKVVILSGIILVSLGVAQKYKSDVVKEKNFSELVSKFSASKIQNLQIASDLEASARILFVSIEAAKLAELDKLSIETLLLNTKTAECFNVNELIQLNQYIQVINDVMPLVKELAPNATIHDKFLEYLPPLLEVEGEIKQLREQYNLVQNTCS